MSELTRKVDLTVYLTKDYTESFKYSLRSDIVDSVKASGEYQGATVKFKKASSRMISQIESGDMPHGLKNAVPNSDEITITSFGEWLHYLWKYLGLLTKIQFYVWGTDELMTLF